MTLRKLHGAVHHWIATTWAKEHIWIALHEKIAMPGDRQVIMTVDLRPGRGGESRRLRIFFDGIQKAFRDLIGTEAKDLIVLIREFPQHACLSEGGELPLLASLTPELPKSAA